MVTDRPGLTGFLDGSRVVNQGDRAGSRVDSLPDEQKAKYTDGFKRGAKAATK
jgi:hypothetical protein